MNDPCQRSTRDVLLYRDGELSPSEQEAFASHLPACSNCRARLEDAASLALLVRDAFEGSVGPLPAGFTERVMGEIQGAARSPVATPRKQRPRVESPFRDWRWVFLGGLALAAAVATVMLPMLANKRAVPSLASDPEQTLLREENEAHIHRLSVDSPDTHSVVLQTAEGRTVIWMISDTQFGADAGPDAP
jgi:anti-sigma factor RsiW